MLRITVSPNTTEVVGYLTGRQLNSLVDAFTVWPDTDKEALLFQYHSKSDNGSSICVTFSGLIDDLKKTLLSLEIKHEIIDKRDGFTLGNSAARDAVNEVNSRLAKTCGYSLFPHQEETLRIALRESFSSYQIATGGGKTLIMGGLVHILNVPTLILVDSVELMEQMVRELSLVVDKDRIGRFGAGIKELTDVTVGIVDSVVKDPKLVASKKYLIVDEAHLAAARTYRECVFGTVPIAKHGFSGTYTRSQKEEVRMLHATTGPLRNCVSASDLVESGILAKPLITMIDLGGVQKRKKNLPQYKMVQKYIVENWLRNKIACEFIVSHYGKKRTVLVFVARVQHGKFIRDMLTQNFDIPSKHVKFISGISGKKGKLIRQEALDNLKNRSCPILIATKIFEKGIDIPSVDVGVNLKGEFTEIGCKQSLGRILRRDRSRPGNVCYYLDFIDSLSPALRAYSWNRHKTYVGERAYKVRRLKYREPERRFAM